MAPTAKKPRQTRKPRKSLDPGFQEADSSNLPVVDEETMFDFFKSDHFSLPESRNKKSGRATRAAYADEAIGFVQVRREGALCFLKAEIVPEHKVNSPHYLLECTINEDEEKIETAECKPGCEASAGGCKHVIALISWLHRRSTEKSRTSIECYWTKPSLSKIGQKFLRVEDIFPSKKCEIPLTSRLSLVDSILLDFHAEGLESCAGSFVHAAEQKSTTIFHLLMDYKKTPLPHSGKSFLEFCNDSISPIDCRTIAQKTSGQAKSKCWFNHRFSRITGSKIFEISRCTTDAGSLVNTILGASKVFETTAMKRGKILEPEVIKEVQKKLKNERGLTSKIEFTGIVVKPSHVIFGASPDGLLPDHIIEIKCPSENQYDKYFTSDKSAPAPKFMAQVQLEMFCCDKKKGLFCVADPKFEKKRDNRVVILNVDFDEDLLKNLINSSQEFWLQSVYPKLYDSV